MVTVTDAGGQVTKTLQNGDSYTISLHFSEDPSDENHKQFATGNLSYRLPDGVSVTETTTHEILGRNNTRVGQFTIDSSTNTLVVTFDTFTDENGNQVAS